MNPVARYTASRRFVYLLLFSLFGLLVSAWVAGVGWAGHNWQAALFVAAIFALTSAGLSWLLMRPRVSVHDTHLSIGRRTLAWPEIRKIDQTGWVCPLVIRLTLGSGGQFLLIYPGEPRDAADLLGYLRQFARGALIDGVPYQEFWREAARDRLSPNPTARRRYPLLRPEDEQEVEQMFHQLKSFGHIESGVSEADDTDEQ